MSAAQLLQPLDARLGQAIGADAHAQGKERLQDYGFSEDPKQGHRIILEILEADQKRELILDFGGMGTRYHPYAAVDFEGQILIFEFPARLYHEAITRDLMLKKPDLDSP